MLCYPQKYDHYLLKGADMEYFENRYMDLSDRLEIEIGISMHKSFKEIARQLHRHPSTISREIRENRYFLPGEFVYGNDCRMARKCRSRHHLCGDDSCSRVCIACQKWNCHDHCDKYVPRHCVKPDRPPYVCNTCTEKRYCSQNRFIYSARRAQKYSDERRSESRRGIRTSEIEIDELNELLVPRIKRGQPLAHIYAAHSEEIPVSLRSLYNYVDQGELKVRNLDLRRKVRYRKRRKAKKDSDFHQEYRIGRTYDDFQFFMQHAAKGTQVEMDTIIGRRGSGCRILSMMLVKRQILLLFLMPDGKAESVKRIFDYLEELLGTDVFQRIFPVFLTDNGSEFKDADGLEVNEFGEIRCNVFYCDPMSSWQKPHIEKAHEFVRYVLPKGTSFKELTQDDLTLLANHINSVKRHSLGDRSPYDTLAENDKDIKLLLEKLKMHPIPADEVHLTKDLLK